MHKKHYEKLVFKFDKFRQILKILIRKKMSKFKFFSKFSKLLVFLEYSAGNFLMYSKNTHDFQKYSSSYVQKLKRFFNFCYQILPWNTMKNLNTKSIFLEKLSKFVKEFDKKSWFTTGKKASKNSWMQTDRKFPRVFEAKDFEGK